VNIAFGIAFALELGLGLGLGFVGVGLGGCWLERMGYLHICIENERTIDDDDGDDYVLL